MSKDNGIRIGWAQRDLTPEETVLLAGQFHTRVAERVHDPITCTALALEEPGGDDAILVSCDLLYVTAAFLEKTRELLAQRLPDFDPRRLIINATHTHEAPAMIEGVYIVPPETPVLSPEAFRAFAAERAADAAAEAWKNRAPGAIARALGHAVVGHNRRAAFFDGSAKMYANTDVDSFASLEGAEDHSLHLLFTFAPEGTLTGVIVNIACPSQVTEHWRELSADYWHETRLELRRRFGEKLFVLPQCAPAGDQSPHFLLYKRLEEELRQRAGVSEREEIALRIADGVERVLPGARASRTSGLPVRHHIEELPLPVRRVTETECAQAKEENARLEADTSLPPDQKHSFFCRNRTVIDRYEKQNRNPFLPVELHVLRLGDAVFATSPFELFLDYGFRIQARSAAAQTFLLQLACGSNGYLATAKALNARLHAADLASLGSSGNYGAGVASNSVGPEGGQILADRTVQRIAGLMKGGAGAWDRNAGAF